MNILGIHGGVSLGQHDAAAALIIDGSLVCCVEEERLNRIKNSTGCLPVKSIKACLKEGNLSIRDIDLIVSPGETYEDIIRRTQRWITHHFGFSPKIVAMNHQTAHVASSFFQSGFDDAMCISYDAWGDRLSGVLAKASKTKGIEILQIIPRSLSLGNFYQTITSFLGFRPNNDEYKVMGLAAYGKPTIDLSFFCKAIDKGVSLDNSYFSKISNPGPSQDEPMYSDKLIKKIGKPRLYNETINNHHKNLAASAQLTIEQCAISYVKYLYSLTKNQNLCLAGGVGLNCSANGVIAKL